MLQSALQDSWRPADEAAARKSRIDSAGSPSGQGLAKSKTKNVESETAEHAQSKEATESSSHEEREDKSPDAVSEENREGAPQSSASSGTTRHSTGNYSTTLYKHGSRPTCRSTERSSEIILVQADAHSQGTEKNATTAALYPNTNLNVTNYDWVMQQRATTAASYPTDTMYVTTMIGDSKEPMISCGPVRLSS